MLTQSDSFLSRLIGARPIGFSRYPTGTESPTAFDDLDVELILVGDDSATEAIVVVRSGQPGR